MGWNIPAASAMKVVLAVLTEPLAAVEHIVPKALGISESVPDMAVGPSVAPVLLHMSVSGMQEDNHTAIVMVPVVAAAVAQVVSETQPVVGMPVARTAWAPAGTANTAALGREIEALAAMFPVELVVALANLVVFASAVLVPAAVAVPVDWLAEPLVPKIVTVPPAPGLVVPVDSPVVRLAASLCPPAPSVQLLLHECVRMPRRRR